MSGGAQLNVLIVTAYKLKFDIGSMIHRTNTRLHLHL